MRLRLRQLWVCYWLNFKVMAMSPFEGLLSIVFPLMFATSALLVYRVENDPNAMLYAGLGAAVMGVWTAMMVPAATLLSRERWAGTLELVVAAPTPFSMVLLPSTLAMATLGLYSVVATMIWDWLVFGIELHIASWPLFVLSLAMACVTVAMLGFLFSVTAVRYRTSWALGAALEYPGWLLCGFLVPLGLLPDVLQPLSWSLAPTWAMAAIRESASGGSPWGDLAVCLALGIAYAALGSYLSRRLVDSARRNATLALT
ncbi:ABC transporter permease [Nocardioides sp. LHG3406-4]|uniref:ABC transporter permease n=1 Tax=Nocardioides sp. LHG3406-4 TaxID=2804575 RepID=UPI003CF61BCA